MRVVLLVLMLSGCASMSEVVPYGHDSYMISADDPGGTTMRSGLQVMAAEKANEFCAKKGRAMETKFSEGAGNAWTGTSAKLIFACVAK